ncbi:TetR/AcrR family transcriptional regulator [Phycicoccus sp. BSK3Z-2]|uniref:TetR/AcrR family transcriptional regulator n=1 Tax=Phycicoccus avicenniae TaxID=2828860 RepID=A0A941HXH8_9MICO|nr:TetR/AcrR family transcriptional regulator [Phycicoccus avicenniae]MBR7741863.1 TetR/AcrR family transcriptional regulator [Phycicoccus avicenniae]
MPVPGDSSKSDARRNAVVASAVRQFAARGFYGTSTGQVAAGAGISQPYVYRLFRDKTALFVAAVDHVSNVLARAWEQAGQRADGNPLDVARLLASYGAVVEDPRTVRFLMHANCAVDEPDIAEALRRCYAKQVDTLTALGLTPEEMREVLGAGLLANVVVGLGLAHSDAEWAKAMSGR